MDLAIEKNSFSVLKIPRHTKDVKILPSTSMTDI